MVLENDANFVGKLNKNVPEVYARLKIDSHLTRQIFGEYHDFFVGMPPNSKNNNSLLNLRNTTGLLTPDLITTKSVLLNSRSPPLKPKAACLWQKSGVRRRTPVLPVFNTSFDQTTAAARKVARSASSVSNVPLRRNKSAPDDLPPTGRKSSQKCFKTFHGSSSLDNVVIKRVIKYCRNINSKQVTKKEPVYGENKTSKPKIYLSDGVNKWERKGQGFMGVPPATPTQEYLENVQYVQCLADFKGKRRLSTKLSEIVKFRDEQKKKEEIERKKFQAIAEKREQELLKVVQRNEIYALNEAMKRLEESNFKEYVAKRNSSCHDNEKNGRNRLGAV